MPNPFDLYGPQFLIFYGALGTVTVAVCAAWMRYAEKNRSSATEIRDPYEIAYLRGGAREVLRVVLVSLIERDLLKQVGGDMLETSSPKAISSVRRAIERQVLQTCQSAKTAAKLFTGSHYNKFYLACEECRQPLRAGGFISCRPVFWTRLGPFLLALGLLAGVAAQKIQVAFSRGRHNIEFLAIMAAVFGVVLCVLLLWPRTAPGNAELRSLKRRFEHLRIGAGGGAEDTFKATMIAAVFGLSALPELDHPYVRSLFPHAQNASIWSGSGCGGSGCAGGSGCSGGGGGGGGCGGGGCGGCGG